MNMKIVDSELNGFEEVELQDTMIDMLQESYDVYEKENKPFLLECSFDEYFVALQEIWYIDRKIGEGIICGSTAYVLNDETRPVFEELFKIAQRNIEIEQCDDTSFEIIMKMTKEEYKETYDVSDFEIEKAYNEAVRNFDTNDFRMFDKEYTLEEFEERAEFGEKAYIDGCAYYKVRNNVDGEPYTIYFEDGDLRIL